MASSPIWGYATRSYKSACVMAAVDLLNPFHRHVPLTWGQRNLAASIAGLGDLMLHLPLLSALIAQAHQSNLALDVALRPDHVELGRRLGWTVLALENPLQSFFNRKAGAGELSAALKESVGTLRRQHYELCLDLSGSAFNALLFKAGGVKRLASRTTRGGASLVAHSLEHVPFENEYAYRARLAELLELRLDFNVYQRLVSSPPRACDEIVLALTTSCRWRNWPVRNFLEVVRSFPGERFVLVGHPDEVLKEDRTDLTKLEALPQVQNLLGKTSVLGLIERIAGAKAVIANDSSAAHVANAYRIPGMVLFGPEDSSTWAMPGGLDVLHDKTCPYFPCVQWRCRKQTEWCMEKIAPREVISHLTQCLRGGPESRCA